MHKEKILIAPSSFASHDKAPLNKLLEKGFEIVLNPTGRRLTKEELLKLLPDVTGIISGVEILDEEILKKSDLKVISRCGSGTSNIDLHATKKLNIQVKSTPTGPVEAVAELTVGAMLCLIRKIIPMDADLHSKKWTKITGSEIRGKNIVIIGFGKIGRRVSELLKPFYANLYAVDPNVKEIFVDGVSIISLKEALAQADIFSLHSSGDSVILGAHEFSQMKPNVYLLNAARGGLIDEKALIDALDKKIVAGAWLDAFQAEPYQGPLTEYPQVILTPHVGSYSFECRSQMELEAVNNLIAAFEK